jgi:hypothetical protein
MKQFTTTYHFQVSAKWIDIIGDNNGEKAVLNVHAWLSRATLDAIGEGMSLFLEH